MNKEKRGKPKLAYLTTQYPSVSHTFIRREIRGLEALGYSVERLAIRPGGAAVDPADIEEEKKTFHCLTQPKAGLLLSAKLTLAMRPVAALKALRMAFTMSRKSDRGLLRHVAYWIEAAVLLRRVRQAGIEHMHVHFGTNAAAVARLMRCLGGPTYSMTIHGPDELDAPIGLSLGAKMTDAAFTVAITDYCAAQLRRWIPLKEWDKIRIVHCTVGEEWFEAAAPVPEDANTLVCVGRLSAQKGQLLLLEAFAKALEGGAKGRLVLVGDGEMRPEVERRIDALGLGDHVVLAGWEPEARVREHLLASRGLVLGSFAEGLPVVLMEAMALQRPVIATAITGIPELVQQGENGWLVIAGNVDQLAEAVHEALTAPVENLNALGRSAAEAVRNNHTTTTEVRKLDALFLELTGKERGGPRH